MQPLATADNGFHSVPANVSTAASYCHVYDNRCRVTGSIGHLLVRLYDDGRSSTVDQGKVVNSKRLMVVYP